MFSLYTSISQNRIIDNLNQYLKWNNLPLRMNESGVCNGLASVYAKYTLENREDEFFTMLKYIAGEEISPEMESAVNHFVVEIVTSFSPSEFNPAISPMHSSEALTINNKPLKAAFNFGTTTSQTNWTKIIKEINLQEDEVMRVVGANHAICVSKKNGLYHIYDPNYSSGSKSFRNEKDLIQEIHDNNFNFIWGDLSMGISVVPHPNKPQRDFPKIPELLRKYPESTSILKRPISSFGLFDTRYFSTLEYAAMWNDGEVVSHLLQVSQDKLIETSNLAAAYNNASALHVLIPKIKDEQTIKELLTIALSFGHEAIVDVLLEYDRAQRIFSQEIVPYGAIHLAAASGNPRVLTKVMEEYKQNLPEISNPDAISAKIISENAIISAISSGSAQCVRYLVNQLTGQDKLSEEQKLLYLEASIRGNFSELTAYFLENMLPESVKLLDLRQQDLRTIDRIGLPILQQLKKAGVQFSEMGNAIIAEKEHNSVGFLVSLRIQLGKFTEFLKSKLFKPDEGNDAINKCNEFRKRLFKTIHSPRQHEENSNPKDTQQDPLQKKPS